METKRPYYRTKADWAAAKAATLRTEASAMRDRRIPSQDWRGVRRKMEAVCFVEREARRFALMAERFKAEGK